MSREPEEAETAAEGDTLESEQLNGVRKEREGRQKLLLGLGDYE